MNKQVMVIAPHPDDETLGCGGSLLRHQEERDDIHWLIVTNINEELGYSSDRVAMRQQEIQQVSKMYRFASVHQLNWPTTRLDTIPMGELIASFSKVIQRVQPEIIYIPYRNDIHTDHRIVFDAAVSCTKWFRYKYIKKVLVYETLSETEFTLNPDAKGFRPNIFVDISRFLDRKIEIMHVYSSEMDHFPFPRSDKAIRSLAAFRGSMAGVEAAEAFMLLKEII